MNPSTTDLLVRLLADRSPTPPSFLPLPSAWSEERRYLTSTVDGMRLVVERHAGISHRLRATSVGSTYGWTLEVEMDVGKRTVSREGFPTLAAAVGDMERGVGL